MHPYVANCIHTIIVATDRKCHLKSIVCGLLVLVITIERALNIFQTGVTKTGIQRNN